MNTLRIILLTYKYQLLKKSQTSSQGFTLIELLIVVLIIGILTAFAFPAFTAVVDKSRYGDARTQMSCLAKELKIFKLENGYYPKDQNRDIVPQDKDGTDVSLKCFYKTNSGKVPFDSVYDYEGRQTTTPDGKTACAYYVVFLGKDTLKDAATDFTLAMKGDNKFYEYKDDLILSIDLVNISSSKISSECK